MQDPSSSASNAMRVVVDITPSIWESMEGPVRVIVLAKFDASEALINVKEVTKRLSNIIKVVRESDPTADMMTPLCLPRYVYLRVSRQV